MHDQFGSPQSHAATRAADRRLLFQLCTKPVDNGVGGKSLLDKAETLGGPRRRNGRPCVTASSISTTLGDSGGMECRHWIATFRRSGTANRGDATAGRTMRQISSGSGTGSRNPISSARRCAWRSEPTNRDMKGLTRLADFNETTSSSIAFARFLRPRAWASMRSCTANRSLIPLWPAELGDEALIDADCSQQLGERQVEMYDGQGIVSPTHGVVSPTQLQRGRDIPFALIPLSRSLQRRANNTVRRANNSPAHRNIVARRSPYFHGRLHKSVGAVRAARHPFSDVHA